MKKLYKFHWDCGRGGEVEGMFIAEEEVIAKNTGESVYFGEILGKHSEVHGTLDEGDLKVISEDQDFITQCEKVFETTGDQWIKDGTISGYNPLDYIREECDECGEELECCCCECEECGRDQWDCSCEE